MQAMWMPTDMQMLLLVRLDTIQEPIRVERISSWVREQALAIAIWVANALPRPRSPVRMKMIILAVSIKLEAYRTVKCEK